MGAATPGFLKALGARFVAGRDFDETDAASPVIVLSESLARFYYPNRDPVGQTFARLPPMFGLDAAPRVVGVVADMKYDGLDAPAGGAIYLSWRSRRSAPRYLSFARRRTAPGTGEIETGSDSASIRRYRPRNCCHSTTA